MIKLHNDNIIEIISFIEIILTQHKLSRYNFFHYHTALATTKNIMHTYIPVFVV